MEKCEYPTSHGQCPFEAEPGSRFCAKHSRNTNERQIGAYLISNKLFSGDAARHADSDHIKSLVGEISMLRALLERRVNAADSDAELTAILPMVKEYSLALDKLVTSWHTMDVKLGAVLGKNALMSLAQKIIGAIEESIRPLVGETPTTEDIDLVVEAVGDLIITAVAEQENMK